MWRARSKAPAAVIKQGAPDSKEDTCEQRSEPPREALKFFPRRHLGQESGWKWGQGISGEAVLL